MRLKKTPMPTRYADAQGRVEGRATYLGSIISYVHQDQSCW